MHCLVSKGVPKHMYLHKYILYTQTYRVQYCVEQASLTSYFRLERHEGVCPHEGRPLRYVIV